MANAVRIKELNDKITALEKENTTLKETIAYLTRKLYGRSSETSKNLNIQGQMSLFDEAEQEQNIKAKEPTLEEVESYLRNRKYNGQRKEKLANLPHEKRIIPMHPEDKFCIECGNELKLIGEEFVRTEVEYIPATLRVIDYYREVYECRKCRKNGASHIEKSPMVDPVIPHSYASATSVAYVMYQKFVNALPLYRLEKEWKNLGLNLSRATMANWIMIASKEWLNPIVEEMHRILLKEKYLHADETTVQVMKEAGRKNTTKSYMWVYGSYRESKTPIRIFEYRPTRSGENADKFLKGFKGYLISDAYQGYNKVEGVTRCYCWAHLRRYFVDAMPEDVKETTAPQQAIERIGQLFKIEEEIVNKSAEERLKIRKEKSTELVDEFFVWIEENQNKYVSKSKIGKAFTYAMNQKEGLMRYLEDGNIEMSNNLAERAIRPFTVGRKNWLFSGSPKGAKASATVYSIVETAKANNLDPYKYLTYIFKSLPGVDLKEYPEFINYLLPWDEQVQAICKKAE